MRSNIAVATTLIGKATAVLRATFPLIRDGVKELVGRKMDALARQFHATHDLKAKEKIERLAREYGELGEPWVFVAS